MKKNKKTNTNRYLKLTGAFGILSLSTLSSMLPIAMVHSNSVKKENMQNMQNHNQKMNNSIITSNSFKNDADFHHFATGLTNETQWRKTHSVLKLNDLLSEDHHTSFDITKNDTTYQLSFFSSGEQTTLFLKNENYIIVDGLKYTRYKPSQMSVAETDDAMMKLSIPSNGIKMGATLVMPNNEKFVWGRKMTAKGNWFTGWFDSNNNHLKSFSGYWHHWRKNPIRIKKLDNKHYFLVGVYDPLFINKKTGNQISSETTIFRKSPLSEDAVNFVTDDKNTTKFYWKKKRSSFTKFITKKDIISEFGSPTEEFYYNNKKNEWKPLSTVNKFKQTLSPQTKNELTSYLKTKEKNSFVINQQLLKYKYEIENSYKKIKNEFQNFNKLYFSLKNKDSISYGANYYSSLLLKTKMTKIIIHNEMEKIIETGINVKKIWNTTFSKTFNSDLINVSLSYPNLTKELTKQFNSTLSLRNQNYKALKSLDSFNNYLNSSIENKLISFKKELILNLAIEKNSLKGNSKTFVSFRDKILTMSNWKDREYLKLLSKYLTDGETNHVSLDEIKKWSAKHKTSNYWTNHSDKNVYNQAGANMIVRSALDYFFKKFKKGTIRSNPKSNPLLAEILNKITFTNMGKNNGYALSYEKNISKNISIQLIPTTNPYERKNFFKKNGYVEFKSEYFGNRGRPLNSFATFMVVAKNGYRFPGGKDINLGEKDKNGKSITSSVILITKTVEPNLKLDVSDLKKEVKDKLNEMEKEILGKEIALDKKISLLNEYSPGSNKKFLSLLPILKKFLNRINELSINQIEDEELSYKRKAEVFNKEFSKPFSDGVKPSLFINKNGEWYISLSIKNEYGKWIYKTINLSKGMIKQISKNDDNFVYSSKPTKMNNNLKEFPWFPEVVMHATDIKNIDKREYIKDLEHRLQNDSNDHANFWKMLREDKENWEAYQIRDFERSPAAVLNDIVVLLSLGSKQYPKNILAGIISTFVSMVPVLGELEMAVNLAQGIVGLVEKGANANDIINVSTNIFLLGFGIFSFSMMSEKSINVVRSEEHLIPADISEVIREGSLQDAREKIKNIQLNKNQDIDETILLENNSDKLNKFSTVPHEILDFMSKNEATITLETSNSIYNIFKSESVIPGENALFIDGESLNDSRFLEEDFGEIEGEGAVGGVHEEEIKREVNEIFRKFEKGRDLGKGGQPLKNPTNLKLQTMDKWTEGIYDFEQKYPKQVSAGAVDLFLELFNPDSESSEFNALKELRDKFKNDDNTKISERSKKIELSRRQKRFDIIRKRVFEDLKILKKEISWRFAISVKFDGAGWTPEAQNQINFINPREFNDVGLFINPNIAVEFEGIKTINDNSFTRSSLTFRETLKKVKSKFLNDIVRIQYILDRPFLINETDAINFERGDMFTRDFVEQRLDDLELILRDKKIQIKNIDVILNRQKLNKPLEGIFPETNKRIDFWEELIRLDQTKGKKRTGDLQKAKQNGTLTSDNMDKITWRDLMELDNRITAADRFYKENNFNVSKAKEILLDVYYHGDKNKLQNELNLFRKLKQINDDFIGKTKTDFFKGLLEHINIDKADKDQALRIYLSIFSHNMSDTIFAFEKLADAILK